MPITNSREPWHVKDKGLYDADAQLIATFKDHRDAYRVLQLFIEHSEEIFNLEQELEGLEKELQRLQHQLNSTK